MRIAFISRLTQWLKTSNAFWTAHANQVFWFSGAGLLLWAWGLQRLALAPGWTQPGAAQPHLMLFGIMMVAMLIYFMAALKIRWLQPRKRTLLIMICVGLGMRLLMLPTQPMGSNGIARYLWEGAVSAQGFNPYEYTPARIAGLTGPGLEALPPSMSQLQVDHPDLVQQLAQAGPLLPDPPVSLILMALAYKVQPWSPTAWRLVLLGMDLILLLLLFMLCRGLQQVWTGILIYWWNPLIILEYYNRAHLALWAWVLVLAVFWAIMKNRRILASAVLALAAAMTYWPGLLLQLVLPARSSSWRTAWKSMAAFLILVGLLSLPVLYWLSKGNLSPPVQALLQEFPNTLFSSLGAAVAALAGWLFGHQMEHWGQLMTALLVITGIMVWSISPATFSQNLLKAVLIISVGFFLFSPIQVPWVYALLLPLLVFTWAPGIILMSITMTLSYLYPYGQAQDWPAWVLHALLWLQLLPVAIVLIKATVKNIRSTVVHGPTAKH